MSETCRLNRAKHGRPLPILLTLLLAFSAACSPAPPVGTWSGPEGLGIEWTPAQPRFGDLVTVTACFPLDEASPYTADFQAGSEPSRGLFDPHGEPVAVRSTHYEGTGARVLWIFRLTKTGDWSWGKGGRLLWTTKTEAGQATELKTFDAPGLWEGRTVAASPAAPAAQPVPGGQP